MTIDVEATKAYRQYAAAYEAQYTRRDLPRAVALYKEVIALHPNSQEAEYSRMQILNIVHAVVPKQEMLDAQIELVLAYFEHGRPSDADRDPVVTRLASGPLRKGRMV